MFKRGMEIQKGKGAVWVKPLQGMLETSYLTCVCCSACGRGCGSSPARAINKPKQWP